jgi:hypothetical protein
MLKDDRAREEIALLSEIEAGLAAPAGDDGTPNEAPNSSADF